MNRKIAIVGIWALFCGSGLAQRDVQFQQQVDSLSCLDIVTLVIDETLKFVQETETEDIAFKRLILDNLSESRKQVKELVLAVQQDRRTLKDDGKTPIYINSRSFRADALKFLREKKECKNYAATLNHEEAKYLVLITANERDYVKEDLVVSNQEGNIVYAGVTNRLQNNIKDMCEALNDLQ